MKACSLQIIFMTLQNLPSPARPPPLPSDPGTGTLAPPAAARQPLRAAFGEAFSPPCQEGWFLFKPHQGSCFNQKVCLRNFMSLFHDCGWEKLGASLVSCSWSAAMFPREQKHIFLPARLPREGCVEPALHEPSCPPALQTAHGHLDGFRGDGRAQGGCPRPGVAAAACLGRGRCPLFALSGSLFPYFFCTKGALSREAGCWSSG